MVFESKNVTELLKIMKQRKKNKPKLFRKELMPLIAKAQKKNEQNY